MLAEHGRIALGTDVATFLRLALAARSLRVLPIIPRSLRCLPRSICIGIPPIDASRRPPSTTMQRW